MIPPYVRGAMAPVFTIFDEDGGLDEAGQRRFLDFLLERGGISAYFVRSGMGQMYTFSEEEVRVMARLAADHLRGRAPVLVGTSGIWDRNIDRRAEPGVYTRQTIDLMQYAAAQGVDGVVITIPEAIGCGPGETPADVTLRFFEAVTGQAQLPVFLYQPPKTDAAYRVTPVLAARLAELPRVAGIKLSSSDAEYLFDVAWALRDTGMALICGCETAFYAALQVGSPAAIGQGATLNPHLLNAIQSCYEAGDLAGAHAAQHATNRLVASCPNAVQFFKRYAGEQGYPVSEASRSDPGNPYVDYPRPMDEGAYRRFKAEFESVLSGADAV